MNTFTQTICVKRWHLFVMLAMTGFATGNILAKIANALGI